MVYVNLHRDYLPLFPTCPKPLPQNLSYLAIRKLNIQEPPAEHEAIVPEAPKPPAEVRSLDFQDGFRA